MIITALNEVQPYIEQAQVLLKSIAINDSAQDITVYMVNFVQNPFLGIHNRVRFVREQFDAEEINRGFMMCYRGLAMRQAMVKYKEPIAWIDTDTIIRRNTFELWKDVGPRTLKIVCQPHAYNKNRFQAGVFAVGYSPETLAFIAEWAVLISTEKKWFADQLYLYTIYEKHREKIRLVPMSWKYNDVGGRIDSFSDDSVIWHGKAGHCNHPLFRYEYEHYKGLLSNSRKIVK